MKLFAFEAKRGIPVAGKPHVLFHVLSESGEFMNFPLMPEEQVQDDTTVINEAYRVNPVLTDNDEIEVVGEPEGHEGIREAYKLHIELTSPVRARMKEEREHIAELHGYVAEEKED